MGGRKERRPDLSDAIGSILDLNESLERHDYAGNLNLPHPGAPSRCSSQRGRCTLGSVPGCKHGMNETFPSLKTKYGLDATSPSLTRAADSFMSHGA